MYTPSTNISSNSPLSKFPALLNQVQPALKHTESELQTLGTQLSNISSSLDTQYEQFQSEWDEIYQSKRTKFLSLITDQISESIETYTNLKGTPSLDNLILIINSFHQLVLDIQSLGFLHMFSVDCSQITLSLTRLLAPLFVDQFQLLSNTVEHESLIVQILSCYRLLNYCGYICPSEKNNISVPHFDNTTILQLIIHPQIHKFLYSAKTELRSSDIQLIEHPNSKFLHIPENVPPSKYILKENIVLFNLFSRIITYFESPPWSNFFYLLKQNPDLNTIVTFSPVSPQWGSSESIFITQKLGLFSFDFLSVSIFPHILFILLQVFGNSLFNIQKYPVFSQRSKMLSGLLRYFYSSFLHERDADLFNSNKKTEAFLSKLHTRREMYFQKISTHFHEKQKLYLAEKLLTLCDSTLQNPSSTLTKTYPLLVFQEFFETINELCNPDIFVEEISHNFVTLFVTLFEDFLEYIRSESKTITNYKHHILVLYNIQMLQNDLSQPFSISLDISPLTLLRETYHELISSSFYSFIEPKFDVIQFIPGKYRMSTSTIPTKHSEYLDEIYSLCSFLFQNPFSLTISSISHDAKHEVNQSQSTSSSVELELSLPISDVNKIKTLFSSHFIDTIISLSDSTLEKVKRQVESMLKLSGAEKLISTQILIQKIETQLNFDKKRASEMFHQT